MPTILNCLFHCYQIHKVTDRIQQHSIIEDAS